MTIQAFWKNMHLLWRKSGKYWYCTRIKAVKEYPTGCGDTKDEAFLDFKRQL